MKEANDLKISAAIRRELSSRRIDLSKIKFPVKAGEVSIEGELVFVGLEKSNEETAIELKFIESSLKNILGVSKVNFELTNWKKNDSGIWEPVGGSSGSALKHLDGEGLVCPECDFVIRFCPCCGKPLVPGAKPGMHKGGITKPIPRKPNLPPIKPIAKKPRPILSPIGSSTTSSLNKNPISSSTTIAKPATPTTISKDKPVGNDSITPKLDSTTKPVVASPVTPVTTPVVAQEKPKEEDNTVEKSESKPAVTSNIPTTTETNKPQQPTTDSKPVAAPKILKPLKPLKPLAGLKPLNKTNTSTQKPEEPPTTASQVSVPNSASNPVPAQTLTPTTNEPNQVEVPKLVEVPEFASTPNLATIGNSENQPTTNELNPSLTPEPVSQNLDSGFSSNLNLNTPVPDFMKNEIGNVPDLQSGLNQNPNSYEPQVPNLNFGLNPLTSEIPQTSNAQPDLGSLNTDSAPIPNLDLNLDPFGNLSNQPSNQTPDLDLGRGFDLNIPTTPTPSTINDLGLNAVSQPEESPIPNLDLGLDLSSLSQAPTGNQQSAPSGNFNQNAPSAQNELDNIFGELTNNLGGNNNQNNQAFSNNTQGFDDTPLPPTRQNQSPAAGYGFENLDDDTPLPPMKPAQPAAPQKAPAKKKSDDIFASLFNDAGLNGNGQDGLGNLDLDLEIFPSGDQSSQMQSPAQTPQLTNDNPFNLGNSVLDLDTMLNTPSNSGSGGFGEKDSSGTFNLDDFDINNFKL